MKFKIKLMRETGDANVARAQIRVADESGAFLEGQIVLEGEKVEQEVMISAGQTVEITEIVRPAVYDVEQKAAVPADLTPGDPLKRPPPTTPEPKDKHSSGSQHGDDKHYAPPNVKK